jgi:8-oxo-dGTP diphosphatase
VGGKIENGETAARAAAREVYEETNISVHRTNLQRMGHLTFLFPYKPEWSQVVHVFVATAWKGQALESREIKPVWVPIDEIPYHQMWDDCRYWLSDILDGRRIKARFTFNPDNDTVAEAQVRPWDNTDAS